MMPPAKVREDKFWLVVSHEDNLTSFISPPTSDGVSSVDELWDSGDGPLDLASGDKGTVSEMTAETPLRHSSMLSIAMVL